MIATPARGPVGANVHIEGSGFTDAHWRVGDDTGLWLAASRPGCDLFAAVAHHLRVTVNGHLSGDFVVPATGDCRQSTVVGVTVSPGRYQIIYQCTACTIGTFDVVAAGPTARDRADSSAPAAGICDLAQGTTANVALGGADMVPAPRCLVIRHDQRLSVTNNTGATMTPTLGTHLKMTLAPGQTATFAAPMGTYLAPGVHRLVLTTVSTAEIWVDAVCQGPGAVGCATP